MGKKTEHNGEFGYLLLADISGFDAYLVDVELEHAQGVMAELLELMLDSLSPPMHIAGIQPDAVLAYKPEAELTRGETLLELTEVTYVTFRDRLKSITRNNTCGCRACSTIPMLDLKFLVHYGQYIAQSQENGRVMLGGLDANLISDRLLKNQAANGSRSYALFTSPSLEHMGIALEGMAMQTGEYPHLGEIRSGSLDLNERYQRFNAERRAFITAEQADLTITYDFPAAPVVVWDWLNDPYKRTRWLRWTKWRPGFRPSGRTDIGAVNHCTHGIGSIVETIIEWQPYRYFTVEMDQASIWFTVIATYELKPLPDGAGTRLYFRTVLQKAPVLALSRQLIKAGLPRKLKLDFERMAELMAADEASLDYETPEPSPAAGVSDR